jgi:hypothetical protein
VSGASKPLLDAREAREQASFTPGERVIVELLRQILKALTAPLDAPGEVQCQHPDEARQDMSSMGEIEWKCRTCGHHYGPVRRSQLASS